MRAYLLGLRELLLMDDIPEGEQLYLDLVVDVLDPSRLLRHHDLENYLTPIVSHLGWRRFVMVRAIKRVGGGSEVSIGRAEPAVESLADSWVQAVVDAGSGSTQKAWKERIRLALTRVHTQLPPGPVEVDLTWRCSPTRNWVMLWKPTGDAMGPVLGEPDVRNPYNVSDDRIVALTLHRQIDDSIGHGIHVGLAWRSVD